MFEDLQDQMRELLSSLNRMGSIIDRAVTEVKDGFIEVKQSGYDPAKVGEYAATLTKVAALVKVIEPLLAKAEKR